MSEVSGGDPPNAALAPELAPATGATMISGREPPPVPADVLREAVRYAVVSRRSIRCFLDAPVAPETIRSILEIAGRAPSGSNIQPWRVHVLTGGALQRVTAELLAAFLADVPEAREYEYYPRIWRSPYIERRRATGWGLYKLAGVGRGDVTGGKQQRSHNYRFFGAPVGLVFTIDNDLEQGSWLDYGMYLQSIMVAARGYGLDTCPQAAIANYPDILRRGLPIAGDQTIVCGMALGYADASAATNALHTEREPITSYVKFHDS